nr:tetratricopeptide repeat protein [Microcoleus sp. FACHB-68]
MVRLPGNLLLSGSAGTGKTTVALYRLLQSLQDFPSGKRLYIAYNPLLVNSAREQFKQLVGNSVGEADTLFQFKTMRDLCLEILESAGQSYLAEDEVNFPAFWLIYRAHPKRKQYPTALVWDEIRSVIKGSQVSVTTEMMGEKEYEKLGKKSGSVIPQNQRRQFYQLAEWYQKKLKQDGRFDEIDLARKVLQVLKQNVAERYQVIVCDEVQDFTELQLELLLQLCVPGGHLFFAGDLHQMISPSGFRWEELKQKFYRRNQEVLEQTLQFNFRSVGNLVNLANQLLKLRSKFLKLPLVSISERHDVTISLSEPAGLQRDESKNRFSGEPARVIAAPAEALKPTLEALNPGDAILVRTDEDKDKFSTSFQSSLVFTIEEAKGLEFDTVFLIEFFVPAQEMWDRFFRNAAVTEKETPQFQLELNLLYVAVTRARRILNIWESTLSQLWSQPELSDCILPLNPELVQQSRVEPTAESWRQRGLYYLKAEFYRQAIECFEKAGDILELHKAKAKMLAQQRQYAEAAEMFVELQEWATAAWMFEKVKQWQEAAKCWAKAGNFNKQQLCETYALEAAKLWEEAAEKWEELAQHENAKRCWLKSSNESQKAKIRAAEFEEKKQWLKASEQYQLAGLFKKAAECQAIEFEKRQQWQPASEQYELAGNPQKAQECRAKLPINAAGDSSNYGKRANHLLSSGDYEGAIAEYTALLQINPDSGYAYHNRGVARHRLKDFAGAIEDYMKALQLLSPDDPKIIKTLGYRGAARAALGDHAGALEDYTQVLQLDPNNTTTYNNRAATRHRLSDYQGAIEDYTQLLRLDPNNALAYANRGAARSALGDHQEAIKDLTLALQHNSSLNQVYYHRGGAHLALGNYHAAINDFNEELQRNSSLAQVYYKRGNAHLAVGNYHAAIEDFNEELRRNPTHSAAYSDRAIARSSLGEPQAAIEDLNQAILLNPKLAAAYNNRGAVRRDLGDTPGALEDYNQAIKINPNYADAYYNRGVSRSVLGDVEGAIEDWQKSVKINPKNPLAYYNLGVSKIQKENYLGALEYYTQALNSAPDFAEAYFERGVTFDKLGKVEEAIQDFQKAAKIYARRKNMERHEEAIANIKKLQGEAAELNEPTAS